MGAHRGRIQEQAARAGERLGLQISPQTLPDSARLPASEAHVNCMPIAQLGRQIAPRASRPLEMEHRFEELPITEFGRSTRKGMLGHLHRRPELLPHGIADDFAHG